MFKMRVLLKHDKNRPAHYQPNYESPATPLVSKHKQDCYMICVQMQTAVVEMNIPPLVNLPLIMSNFRRS